MIHQRIARRIALNFLRIRNSKYGLQGAVAWYDNRFGDVTKEDHDEIKRQLNLLKGKKPKDDGPKEIA